MRRNKHKLTLTSCASLSLMCWGVSKSGRPEVCRNCMWFWVGETHSIYLYIYVYDTNIYLYSVWMQAIDLSACAIQVTTYGASRRKFRSQTSDNMERWKAEQGRGTEKRKIRREKIRRERVRGQKIQMREKVGKSRNTVFFQWFVAPEGRKVGSLKRRVRSQLATGAMKNCTPLWREAHFQVKMYKTPGVRTTFGSWDVEKVHAVVARSTFRSQKCYKTHQVSDHFWKLRCRKSVKKVHAVVARSTFSKSKVYKTHQGSDHFFEVEDVEKVARRCGAKHISKSKCTKLTPGSDHFWKLRCRKSARLTAKQISKSKVLKTDGLGPLLDRCRKTTTTTTATTTTTTTTTPTSNNYNWQQQ